MKIYGTKFQKKGDVGIVTVFPSKNGNGSDLALQAIREKVQSDESIKLIFITGEGDRSALLREIFEVDKRMAHRLLRRMKGERERRSKVRKDRQHLTH